MAFINYFKKLLYSNYHLKLNENNEKFANHNLEKLCLWVLDHSCPWTREGLSSNSRFLASEFFLSPRPWPRTLCPRLHLRLILTINVPFIVDNLLSSFFTSNYINSCLRSQHIMKFISSTSTTRFYEKHKIYVNKALTCI